MKKNNVKVTEVEKVEVNKIDIPTVDIPTVEVDFTKTPTQTLVEKAKDKAKDAIDFVKRNWKPFTAGAVTAVGIGISVLILGKKEEDYIEDIIDDHYEEIDDVAEFVDDLKNSIETDELEEDLDEDEEA